MKPRFFIFISLSILCLAAAGVLAFRQAQAYERTRGVLPAGSMVAGLPAGGRTPEEAGRQAVIAYAMTPVELRYQGSVIHIDPTQAGQTLNTAGMVEKARAALQGDFWPGYWASLWNQPSPSVEIPLECSVDDTRLQTFLDEALSLRYGQTPTRAAPDPGGTAFQPGKPGVTLALDLASQSVTSALCARENRVAELTSVEAPPLPPTVDALEFSLTALVQASGYDGLIELYYQDLRTGEVIQLALNDGKVVEPGVAFTAASTIKIPVMISAYKQVDGELPANLRRQMAEMIDLSDNLSTDKVMESVLDENIAPVQVTQDIRALGLQNTFLAGFFYPGAPLLDRYTTPANQRTDLSTDPDVYNQTTAGDMGVLLSNLYQCSTNGSGPLVDTYGAAITQAECQEMVDLLATNRKGVLIEVGLPEGTRMAHKYGWVTDALDGLLHTASDAAIVYTPGGDFVLTAYLYHPNQLQWEPAQNLVAYLTAAAYNYHVISLSFVYE